MDYEERSLPPQGNPQALRCRHCRVMKVRTKGGALVCESCDQGREIVNFHAYRGER